MKNILLIIIVIFILGAIAYGYKQSQSNVKNQDAPPANDQGTMIDDWGGDKMDAKSGQYVDYDPALLAKADDGDVVLFFYAAWCPSCRALESGIKKDMGNFPDDLTILKVNYDEEKELKKKYTVTYQHTLVQVDSQGNEIAKWNGGNDLNSILKNLK